MPEVDKIKSLWLYYSGDGTEGWAKGQEGSNPSVSAHLDSENRDIFVVVCLGFFKMNFYNKIHCNIFFIYLP